MFRDDPRVFESQALFYIPESHPEKWGMARMEPGVSLYSRRVLIQPRSDKLLPDWMRFVKGVPAPRSGRRTLVLQLAVERTRTPLCSTVPDFAAFVARVSTRALHEPCILCATPSSRPEAGVLTT